MQVGRLFVTALGFVVVASCSLSACDDAQVRIEGDEAGECDDGVDNDQDMLTDCLDSGCEFAIVCVSEVSADEGGHSVGTVGEVVGSLNRREQQELPDGEGTRAEGPAVPSGPEDGEGSQDDATNPTTGTPSASCADAGPCDGHWSIENSSQLAELEAAHCSSISGDLVLSLTSFDSTASVDLDCLTSVGGDLRIYSGSNALAVNLPKLETVAQETILSGSFVCNISQLSSIGANDSHAALTYGADCDLPKLNTLQGGLWIYGWVTSLSGLSELKSVGGRLRVEATAVLETLEGLTGLDSVGESISYTDEITIKRNHSLKHINAFNSIDQLTVDKIAIRENPKLETVDGFNNLKNLDDLWIWDNPKLEVIAGFSSLSHGTIHIMNNPGLTEINGFQSLVSGVLGIKENESLETIGELGQLQGLGLGIEDNASLESLGLSGTSGSIGNLTVRNNPNLVDLDGLPSVTGFVELEDNPALIDLSGLSKTSDLSSLRIYHCHALEDLDGLYGIDSIGSISITWNDSLCQSIAESFASSKSGPSTEIEVVGNKDCSHSPTPSENPDAE